MSNASADPNIEQWQAARSLDEMAELTARYIEGNSSYFPGFAASTIDRETLVLVDDLVKLNRSGYMTVMSQPGNASAARKQRAFVAGFAPKELAHKIARLALYSDLLVLVVPSQNAITLKTPVIVDENRPRGWMGVPSSRDFAVYETVISDHAKRELQESWSVSLIDLQWGRAKHLWELLGQAVGDGSLAYPEISLRPHPDMNMETDYFC